MTCGMHHVCIIIHQVLSNVVMNKRSSMAHVQAHFKRLADAGRGTEMLVCVIIR